MKEKRGSEAAVGSWFRDRRFLRRPALLLSLIYLLAISAILRVNVYYLDDIWRAMEGQKGWDYFSRYLSVFFSDLLHTSRYLTDISPLPQILAALLMGLSSAILIHAVTGREKFHAKDLIAALPLALVPYFLECFSYRYDAPYMALSVLASVAPLLLLSQGSWQLAAASAAGALVMCTTYQASSGIYPMAVLTVLFLRWSRGEDLKGLTLRSFFPAAGGYLAGLLIFRMFIMRYVDDYVSVAISRNGFFSYTFENYRTYYGALLQDFRPLWLVLAALVVLCFIVSVSLRSSRNKALTVLLSVIVTVLLALMMFGVYPFLRAPLYAPRAMYGVGAFLALMALAAVDGEKAVPQRICAFALSWCFFSFAFTYGNALGLQDVYARFRMTEVVSDLSGIEAFANDEEKIVQISGSIGYAPQLRNYPHNYRMLEDLVPITFQDTWNWGSYSFFHLFDMRNIAEDSEQDLREMDLPLVKESMYNSIYGDGEHFLIVLK